MHTLCLATANRSGGSSEAATSSPSASPTRAPPSIGGDSSQSSRRASSLTSLRPTSRGRGLMRIPLTSADSPTPKAAYSQAIATEQLVFTAGFGPHDPVTGSIVGDEIQAQTRQTLTNIERILGADRLGLDD